MREHKFRVWNDFIEKFEYFTFKNVHMYLSQLSNALLNGREFEQYTGLKDKNGVEIYEGDIILVPYNHIGECEVKFVDGSYNITRYRIDSLIVIGNIHENKELL